MSVCLLLRSSPVHEGYAYVAERGPSVQLVNQHGRLEHDGVEPSRHKEVV